MTISLHAATVPSYLQILNAVGGLLDKAEQHCGDQGLEPTALIQARLAEDMFPFAAQVKSIAAHSLGAITAAFTGDFRPDFSEPPSDFAGLRARVDTAIAGLEAVDPAALDARIGETVIFTVRDMSRPFRTEDFLLSFSQPNFYFHAATAYDILRWKGVPVGKRDFLGQTRSLAPQGA